MASTCVNHIGISSDSFLERPSTKLPSYSWLSKGSHLGEDKKLPSPKAENSGEHPADVEDFGDFEFRLEDNFTMLPADELFFDGKLMPLHLPMVKPATSEAPKLPRNEILMDPYLFSPKAPRCTTRWKELLGLRKLYQKEKEKEKENNLQSNSSSATTNTKSFRKLLHRSSKSSLDNLPLLKDENEMISTCSSRLSLSSSSSSHEHDDLPRLSLDADNKQTSPPLPRLATGGRRSTSCRIAMRRQTEGVSMESPRMNASGKIVFQSLERSTSSPSSYGGPRYKHSSVQRSYSANVRVTPVLNVPVCSKSGSVFGLFGSSSSHSKRDSFGSINGASCSKAANHNQSIKHRKDRN